MYQERKLPESNRELLRMWRKCGKDNKATGKVYGVGESPVRKRIRRIKGPTGRRYVRLPKPVEELYAEWLATGTEIGSIGRLAVSYGLLPTTLRRAFRNYRARNSEEDECLEQEADRDDPEQRADVRGNGRHAGARHPECHLPQHAHGRQVR